MGPHPSDLPANEDRPPVVLSQEPSADSLAPLSFLWGEREDGDFTASSVGVCTRGGCTQETGKGPVRPSCRPLALGLLRSSVPEVVRGVG